MLRIAICDDEKQQQQIVEQHLTNGEISEGYEIHKFDSGEDLISSYEREERFSIILLDMKMNKLDGIQTAEIIRKYDNSCIIIIITSILEYAIKGYSIDAYDFILKPIDPYKFEKILRSAVKKLHSENNKTYNIQTRDKISFLRLSDIVYIESNRKKVTIHCVDCVYSNNENISMAENKLSADGFVRIGRYYLVNMLHIKEIAVKSILLSSGESLNYSKKHQKYIKKRYMDFMMEDM